MQRIKTGGGENGEENPSEPVLEEGPNPLLNYAILAELMSYLPVPDLRRCRLVNSSWRTAATPYLKNNSWLGSHKTFSKHHGRISPLRHDVSLSQYLGDLCFSKQGDRDQELTELGLFGNQNLRVHLPPFLQSSSTKGILLKFLEDFGTNFRNVLFEISIGTLELLGTALTSLTNLVSISIIFSEDPVPGVVWHVWPSTTLPRGVSSIKRIYIDADEDEENDDPEVRGSIKANNHYAFLKRLLQIAPNLEALELVSSLRVQMPNWNPDVWSDYWIHKKNNQSETLYLRLLKDEGKAICPKLKDLNFADYISPWDMKLMLQLDINFRELVLSDLMAYTLTVKEVGDFILSLLERHQSSLEVLEFQIASETYDDSPISLRFPYLPKLRKLLIGFESLFQDDFPGIRFDPVDYATQFPALQELSLLYDIDYVEYVTNLKRGVGRIDFYNQFFPNDGQVCPTLQRLTVKVPRPKRKKSWNLSSYQQFSWRLELMFPNVHNHDQVKACRAMKKPVGASDCDTRRVTRSMTAGCEEVCN